MVVTKTEVVPIEAIVRGHLAGSAWETYREDKMINGEVTEDKLDKYEKLNKPIFTPSTKADVGDKDINISKAEMDKIIGKELADEISRISLALYDYAYCYALERGVIIADTKFEFGLDKEGKLLLIDEIFTPDCSRFWLYDNELGKINYDAFDKQFFRDYLIKSNWDNEQIQIPDNIKQTILSKYNTAYELITHNE
jgi:phosphoribosylaminoimidazole-succinocarboxamide synthase